MNYLKAKKSQLLQIALYEDCDMEAKYRACEELQYRYVHEETRAEIMLEVGRGKTVSEISEDYGISEGTVKDIIRAFSQKHKSGENWRVGYQVVKKISRRSKCSPHKNVS